jgi:beta-fructofuranosidase
VGAASEPNWSGALVCHKILQKADGTLTLGEVPAMAAKYSQRKEVKVMAQNGAALEGVNGKLSGDNAYILYNRLGAHNHLSFKVTASDKWDKFGISLVRGTDSKKYYTMVINPEWDDAAARKVNFEEEGEEGKGFVEGIDGYVFARPADNVYQVDIFTDNSVVVMYINDVCAYTQRIYGIQKNCWSINSYGGSITVSDLAVTQY